MTTTSKTQPIDQPTESDAENEPEPASGPKQRPTNRQRHSGRRGEIVMTFAMPEPVCPSCGGSALRGPSPEGDSAA